MPTQVVMPQMGESIAEGTIVRWIKKIGDTVERDEPLLEISTDKVDAEIPSPVAGVITEIRAKEGETVPVNSVVAVIGPSVVAGEAPASQPAAVSTTATAARPAAPQADAAATAAAASDSAVSPHEVVESTAEGTSPVESSGAERALRQRSSPVVRKIA